MDAKHFDTLARATAGGFTRRRLSRSLIAGLAAPFLPGLVNHAGAATCKKTGKKCDRNSDCCDHAECPGNKCRCKKGFKDCNRKCYKLENDEKHCGRCNNKCKAKEKCCDGKCADLDTDAKNCNACGRKCAADEECVDGACIVAGVCTPGTEICSSGTSVACGETEGCVCAVSTEGEMYCGEFIDGELCGSCTDSSDCHVEHGPDTFCLATGSTFCCGPSLQNECMRKCPATAT